MLTTESHPAVLAALAEECAALGFAMSCDLTTGRLLRTLAAARPGGRVLELGTGAGVGTSWLLSGMDPTARLTSVELDAEVAAVAAGRLGADPRLELVVGDGAELIDALEPGGFDLVFADTWPGKFHHLDQALALLAPGGTYLIDDLLPQPTWPDDHAAAVVALVERLTGDPGLHATYLDCSTGLLLATRRP
ncbi:MULTISPECIES: class I SAM-dependent methyltransferase [Kitasatospora]|uniref:Putative methyltransferase n=1 Tax=Kitasatospora setae (strain ATCC 33774 / DSM 43861 / JCM 3304 / KCC A-0304 / NBRC 14216 / KM-6054) TaxID=452652 RepID=E4N141_KITSK|nr:MULTISPECIES: class I SAM-dependent methyltransferase [Kitasatospora]BAJ31875.1 putative methyltransferase [Kitasatospora setae KM-6054]